MKMKMLTDVAIMAAVTLLFAIEWTDARKKRSISQTPTQDAGTDTGLQNDVVQEQNIIIQGDNKSSPASKQHGENRKIPNIDGTTLEFIYWNTELGNDKSENIEFGNERKIIDFWIRDRPLKVITHGFINSANSTGVMDIKSGYIATGCYNVITVDWSRVANNIVYPIPAYLTVRVGNIVAKFLTNIVELGLIDPSGVHLIGHSLGAHVFGATGAAFSSDKIGRITGLDPAAPGFEKPELKTQPLNSTNAQFVDVIHTSAGVYGYSGPVGHADFYPNLGVAPQPGCELAFPPFEWMTPAGCSHTISSKYYADSVYRRKSFVAVKCDSPEEYVGGLCKHNIKNFMGHDADPNKKGIFFLKAHTTIPVSGFAELIMKYFS